MLLEAPVTQASADAHGGSAASLPPPPPSGGGPPRTPFVANPSNTNSKGASTASTSTKTPAQVALIEVYFLAAGSTLDHRVYYVKKSDKNNEDMWSKVNVALMGTSVVCQLRKTPAWTPMIFKILTRPPRSDGDNERETVTEAKPEKPSDNDASSMMFLRSKLYREVSSADDVSKAYAALTSNAQVLFAFKEDVRLRIDELRKISGAAKNAFTHGALELPGSASEIKFFVETAKLEVPPPPPPPPLPTATAVAAEPAAVENLAAVMRNVMKIHQGSVLLIACKFDGGQIVNLSQDVSFELDETLPPPEAGFPLRVVLGMVTSCHCMPRRDHQNFIVTVRRSTRAATTASSSNSSDNHPGRYYKVIVFSVLTRARMNAWVDTDVPPGTLCLLDEKIDPATRRLARGELWVLSNDDDFAAWAADLTQRSDDATWLSTLRALGSYPFAPTPIRRFKFLQALDSIDPARALIALPTRDPNLPLHPCLAKFNKFKVKAAQVPAPPPPPPAGCLLPVWIVTEGCHIDELSHGSFTALMQTITQTYHPAVLCGAAGPDDPDFTVPTDPMRGGYSPTVFVMVMRDTETTIACLVAHRSRGSPEAWQWVQHGHLIQVTDPLARSILGDVVPNLNPRDLTSEDGKLKLDDFLSRCMDGWSRAGPASVFGGCVEKATDDAPDDDML